MIVDNWMSKRAAHRQLKYEWKGVTKFLETGIIDNEVEEMKEAMKERNEQKGDGNGMEKSQKMDGDLEM